MVGALGTVAQLAPLALFIDKIGSLLSISAAWRLVEIANLVRISTAYAARLATPIYVEYLY